MEKIQAEFKYGWRPDLPDIRDLRYSASMETINTLPSKVDLRKNCPPILNQIPFNSCTANAIAVAHQFEQIKQRAKANFTPSRLFIYYNEREIEGTVDYDSGAYLRDGFKSIAKQGVCPETMWPYEIEKFATKPSNDCYADALDHQVLRYLGVEQSENHLKACLAEGYPFVFGFTVYQSFESQQVTNTGIVSLPSQDDKDIGGHAVIAVGYDDQSRRFIVQNSWGESWGDKGFFYIPYEYLTNPNLSGSFWTIRLIELDDKHNQPKDVLALKLSVCVDASYSPSTNKIYFKIPIYGDFSVNSPITIPVGGDLKACAQTCGTIIPSGLKATVSLNGTAILTETLWGYC